MGALTNYLESGIINHIFRASAYTAPTSLEICLMGGYTAASVESGIVTEVVCTGYPVGANLWIEPYTTGTAMATHNVSGIEFPVHTGADQVVSGVYIKDNSDKILFYGALTNTRTLRDQDQFVFSSGALKITFD